VKHAPYKKESKCPNGGKVSVVGKRKRGGASGPIEGKKVTIRPLERGNPFRGKERYKKVVPTEEGGSENPGKQMRRGLVPICQRGVSFLRKKKRRTKGLFSWGD